MTFPVPYLSELMTGCPALRSICSAGHTFITAEAVPPLLDLAETVLTTREGKEESKATAPSLCQWARTLTELNLGDVTCSLPVAAAIAHSWPALTSLEVRVPSSAPPLLLRFILESLPSLQHLSLYTGRAVPAPQQAQEAAFPLFASFSPSSSSSSSPVVMGHLTELGTADRKSVV